MRLIDRSGGCTCDVRADFAAVLQGEPQPLCRVHHAKEITQRAVEAQQQRLAEDAARLRAALDDARANGPTVACTCRELAEVMADDLAGRPSTPCALHVNGARIHTSSRDAPLNGNALPAKLAALLGATVNSNEGNQP